MTYIKDVIQGLIGSYNPIVTTLSDGSEIVQYDIEYIASAILLLIGVYCIFKVIGGLICSKI